MPAIKTDTKDGKAKVVKGRAKPKSKSTKADVVEVAEASPKAKPVARKRGEVEKANGNKVIMHEVPDMANGDGPKEVEATATKTKRVKKPVAAKEPSVPKETTKVTKRGASAKKPIAEEIPEVIPEEPPVKVEVPKPGKTKAKVTKKPTKVIEEVKDEAQTAVTNTKRGRSKKSAEPNTKTEPELEEPTSKNKIRKMAPPDNLLELNNANTSPVEEKPQNTVTNTKRGRPKKSAEPSTEAEAELEVNDKPLKKVEPKARSGGRAAKKAAVEAIAKENVEETEKAVNEEESKPTKAKTVAKPRGAAAKKKQGPVTTDTQEDTSKKPETDNGNEKKSRKRAAPTEEKVAKVPKNSTTTLYEKESFVLEPDTDGNPREFTLKITSWNVAGLRSWIKKDGLKFLDYEEPDIFCLQETKCATDQLPDEAARLPGYHPYWLCMPGGYAGVAIYSKIMPIHVEYGIKNEEFDNNGRIITAEYEKFYLVNVYVPNSGKKLVNLEARMRWEQLFLDHVERLDKLKAVIICGDMNVSHEEIDLANPKANARNAGFTAEERERMSKLLSAGFVDIFRELYPKRTGAYTYWTYMANARSRNIGWRLDYFLVSQRFTSRVVDNTIRAQCKGSDHCPITLFLNV